MNGQLLWEWRRCRWQHQHEGQWAYRRSSSVRGGDAGCDFYLVITVNQLMTRVNTCRQDPENSLWKHEKSSTSYCLPVSLCELKLLKKKKKERERCSLLYNLHLYPNKNSKKESWQTGIFIYLFWFYKTLKSHNVIPLTAECCRHNPRKTMTAQFKSVQMKFNPHSSSEQLNLELSASSGRPWDDAEAPASACCDQTSVISAEHPRAHSHAFGCWG